MSRRWWTVPELARLHAMKAEGLAEKEIAWRLGRTHSAVENKLRQHRQSSVQARNARQQRVLAALQSGKSQTEIASIEHITQQAVSLIRKRHNGHVGA